MSEEDFNKAKAILADLVEHSKCIQLATVSSEGVPEASYAPVLVDASYNFYVYISSVAKHVQNLKAVPKASAMLIEDESTTEQMFARTRLVVSVEASILERSSSEWERVMQRMEERHGSTLAYLKEMSDFDLFCLRPLEMKFVCGFGQAYKLSGPDWSEIDYLSSGSHKKG